MIKAVFFDLDGVLTTDADDLTSTSRWVCGQTGIDKTVFETEYDKLSDGLYLGTCSHLDIWETLCQRLGRRLNFSLLEEAFLHTPIDTKMEALAARLKKNGCQTGIITVNANDRTELLATQRSWNRLFDSITVSASVGSGKTFSTIFEKAVESLHVSTEECFFIDNREKNLVVPNRMGMHTFYFDSTLRDHAALRQVLAALSVKLT